MSFVEDREENLTFARHSSFASRAARLDELSFVEDPVSDLWDSALSELIRIQGYDVDWDGEGTPAPRRDLVASAMNLLKWLRVNGWEAPLRVLCTVNSKIAFEWQTPFDYVQLEVTMPGRGIWTQIVAGSEEATESVISGW